MTEASSIINDALTLMGEASSILPSDPENQSKGFTVLKGMIAEWAEDGIEISISEPYDISDDIGEENHLTQTIIALLASRLAPYLQAELEPSAIKRIEIAEDRILKYAPDPDIVLPDNLPRGQGNQQLRGSPFFKGT